MVIVCGSNLCLGPTVQYPIVTGKVTQRYYTKGISIKVGTKYFWALGILDQGAHGDAEVLHGGTSILDLRRPRE
jgi:hypothetical protein